MASSRIEQKVSVAVGSHLSAGYASWISDLHKSADAFRTKNPDEWHYVTTRMGLATLGICGITAAIIAGVIVWSRRELRMSNQAVERTADQRCD